MSRNVPIGTFFETFLGHLLLLGVGNLYLWRHWWSEYSKKFWITIGHAHWRKSCGYHKQSRWVLDNAVINFMSYSKSLAQYDFRFHEKFVYMKNHFKIDIKNHLINQFIRKKNDQSVWFIFHNSSFLFDYIFWNQNFQKMALFKDLLYILSLIKDLFMWLFWF